MSDPLLTLGREELEAWPPGRLADYLSWYCAEVERLRAHVDVAFAHAVLGDVHGARVELTKARWGQQAVNDGKG